MLAAAKGGTPQSYGKYCAPLVIFANLATQARLPTIFNYRRQVVAAIQQPTKFHLAINRKCLYAPTR
jgi:hypothetical protein